MQDPEMCKVTTVTILATEKISSVLEKAHYKDIAIILPANWTTSVITFTGCATPDGTFVPIVFADDVGAVTIPSVAASQCIVLNGEIRDALAAVPYIRIVASTTQASTDKVITIIKTR